MARLPWETRVLLSCALAGACIGGAFVARGADESFTLRVTDPDGAPVARARASFEPAEPSAADGRYVDVAVVDGQAVFLLPPQRGSLCVWGAANAGGEPRNLGPQARRIERPVAGIEIRLEAGMAIEGRVLDEVGKAVANVKVTATGTTPEWSVRDLPHGVAGTDAQGAFRIQGLADIPYILDADAAGRFAHPPSKGAHPGRGEVTIVLRKGIVTTITVVDASGNRTRGIWRRGGSPRNVRRTLPLRS